MRRFGSSPRGLVFFCVLIAVLGLALAGGAAANDEDSTATGISNREVIVPGRADIDQLIAEGYDLAEYVRPNDDGTFTINVVGDGDEFAAISALGYTIGGVIEDDATVAAARAERQEAIEAEQRSADYAQNGATVGSAAASKTSLSSLAAAPELVPMRAEYFDSYGGRFLSLEVFDSQVNGTGSTGPTVSVSWREAGGSFGAASTVPRYIDSDPTPDAYMYNRLLIRMPVTGGVPATPAFVRYASSTGATVEAPVTVWVGSPLAHGAGFMTDFLTHYMDPTEGRQALRDLHAEFPNLTDTVQLPNLTNGYQRKSAAIMAGTTTSATPNIGSAPAGTPGTAGAVVLTANKFGQNGGNNVRAQFRNPGVANSALSISVTPNAAGESDVIVNLATGATGALSSTAAQIVAAINADPAASAVLSAQTWAGNAGGSVTQARSLVNLSDFLAAPTTGPNAVTRGPFQMEALRIGKVRDGSKTGVYLFCEQHAREWVTPNTCVETAYELLKNYAVDARTRELVDNLDIFILPSANPDGSHHSFYDFNSQRRNLTNYCAPTSANSMPSARNSWGVDLNRNSESYSLFDGYFGASTSCTSDTFAGPSEASEPETKNLNYIINTFSNVKFANNVHTYGGYFMWAPGSYTGNGRVTAPAPNIGIEGYFFKAADTVLQRIKDSRGTAVLPSRTGPIADVLYSAAGNAADDFWYRKGIIAYSFEAGSDRFTTTSISTPTFLSVASASGATAVRVSSTANLIVGQRVKIDGGSKQEFRTITAIATTTDPAPNVTLDSPLVFAHEARNLPGALTGTLTGAGFFQLSGPIGSTSIRLNSLTSVAAGNTLLLDGGTANQEVVTVASVVSPNPAAPTPNVTLTAPLAKDHYAGSTVVPSPQTGTGQSEVGFFPTYFTEGKFESLEFAAGNFGLLESALDYENDHTAPTSTTLPAAPKASQTPIDVTFKWLSEPSVIHYTLDGTDPTNASPFWNRQGPRRPGEIFTFSHTTTVKWFATDIVGNTSAIQSARFAVETDAPETSVHLSPGAVGGYYRNPTVSFVADDHFDSGGAGIDFTKYTLDGGAEQTYSAPFQVTGDGHHSVTFHSVDLAGNVEADQTVTFEVDATPPVITLTKPLNGDSYLLDSIVKASFSCADALAGLFSCDGTVANTADISTSPVGFHSFTVTASDVAGNSTTKTVQYNVFWQFSGLQSPSGLVKPNGFKAGSTIPVKFTLGGDRGLAIFAVGYPTSVATSCVSARAKALAKKIKIQKSRWLKGKKRKHGLARPGTFSSVVYASGNNQYLTNWTTEAEWAGTCRLLVLGFTDNTVYTAFFDFR